MEQRQLFLSGPTGSGLNRAAVSRRLSSGYDPHGRGDARLLPGSGKDEQPTDRGTLTPASVLVLLVDRPEGATVLLTQRTLHLAHHPGQISFPGGRQEPDDHGDVVRCALRETEEETGLPASAVDVLGRLDDYTTGTGFGITPVVGAISPPLRLAPDPFEVAEIFEVPLAFVLDPDNHKLHRVVVAGRHRPFWALDWDKKIIWGATAGILVNLSEVLGRTGE